MNFAAIVFDPILSKLVILAVIIITIGFALRLLNQPYVIAYIIAGILLGPHGFKVVTDEDLISNLGSLGLVLLLFFIGMEISLSSLIANWRISIIGTLVQVLASVGFVWIIGSYLDWTMNRIVMLGFVISLSSTAVIIKLLQDRNEIETDVGQNVISILLAQDIIVVPMLIIMNYLGGEAPSKPDIIRQIVGGIIILGIIFWILKRKQINLPFRNYIRKDRELQVFVAFTLCFGFAILTAVLGLSSALGAFVAGALVSSARATQWVHDSLHSFRVVFVALFFVSVGMLIDLNFLKDNIAVISVFLLAVFIVNQLINTLTMKMLGDSWRDSIYFGAWLSQIGEFSFILGTTGYYSGMITEYGYQLVISVIALSLLFSPFWILLTQKTLVLTKINGERS